jgi:hypothetical protein
MTLMGQGPRLTIQRGAQGWVEDVLQADGTGQERVFQVFERQMSGGPPTNPPSEQRQYVTRDPRAEQIKPGGEGTRRWRCERGWKVRRALVPNDLQVAGRQRYRPNTSRKDQHGTCQRDAAATTRLERRDIFVLETGNGMRDAPCPARSTCQSGQAKHAQCEPGRCGDGLARRRHLDRSEAKAHPRKPPGVRHALSGIRPGLLQDPVGCSSRSPRWSSAKPASFFLLPASGRDRRLKRKTGFIDAIKYNVLRTVIV